MWKTWVTAAGTLLASPGSYSYVAFPCKIGGYQHYYSKSIRVISSRSTSSVLQASALDSSGGFKSMNFEFTHLESVKSTQDEAKRILSEQSSSMKFALSAGKQNLGRGTNGRTWIGKSGNMFLTIALPFDSLPVSVTLLPLKVGSVVASRIKQILGSESKGKVTLKWPNDTLINDKKVAGVLIETGHNVNNDLYFLIGIGVNIVVAPEVPSSGSERGRTATSINEFVDSISLSMSAEKLAYDISNDIFSWIEYESSRNSKEQAEQFVIEEWKSFVNNWGKTLMLRDDSEGFSPIIPLDIERDGQLRVRDKFGREKLLCADYLL